MSNEALCWKNVKEHGLMSTKNGSRSVCMYATAEGCHEVMTDLLWWAEIKRGSEQ